MRYSVYRNFSLQVEVEAKSREDAIEKATALPESDWYETESQEPAIEAYPFPMTKLVIKPAYVVTGPTPLGQRKVPQPKE